MTNLPHVLVLSEREDVCAFVEQTLGSLATIEQKALPGQPSPALLVADLADGSESLAQSLWAARGAPVFVLVTNEADGVNALARGAAFAALEPANSPQARLLLRSAFGARSRSETVVAPPREDGRSGRGVEEQLQHSARLATIGEIAAAVAHEVNNPLQFMSVCLDELRGALTQAVPGHAGSDLRSLLDDALEGLERIRSITVELLPFARSSPSAIEDIDLNKVIMRALRMMRNDLRHRARIHCDLDEIPMLRGDPRRLAQVFTNLLLNAAQAIEEGQADANSIRITSRRDGEEVRISVADSGQGIPSSLLPRVFERFFTTKPSGMGTGLGMSVCQEVVRAHGGHIFVESQVGRGTTVTIVLPLRTALVVARESTTPPPVERRSLRILAVDDDLLVLKSYRRALGKSHSMTFASDGEDALALLAVDASFDVIVCDLMMPNMDGPCFHDELQRHYPELLQRIVFCSGGTFTPRAAEFVKQCKRPLVYKPVHPDELLDVLFTVVAEAEKKEASRQANADG